MKLIINADDFGLSKSITDGIVDGIQGGYITSTSIMANMDYAKYATQEALKQDIKCIGLHVNLTVGKPILNNPHLVGKDGMFLYNNEQINNPNLTYEDAYYEIKAQIGKVTEYSGGKLIVDHINTHHLLLKNEHIKRAVLDIAKEYHIPVRNEVGFTMSKEDLVGVKAPDKTIFDFTIENVTYEKLASIAEGVAVDSEYLVDMNKYGWNI